MKNATDLTLFNIQVQSEISVFTFLRDSGDEIKAMLEFYLARNNLLEINCVEIRNHPGPYIDEDIYSERIFDVYLLDIDGEYMLPKKQTHLYLIKPEGGTFQLVEYGQQYMPTKLS